MTFTIRLDSFAENATYFYKVNPFFYDKARMFWFWDKNQHKYEIKDDTDVMIMLDDMLGMEGQTVTSSIKNNYLEAFRRVGRKNIPKDPPKKWIQFKDKAFSLGSGEIYDVTPDYFFTNPIPWELGATDETPIMDKLFKEWVGEDFVQTLYEILAYCCYSGYPIQSLFCFWGSGRNGKTQYTKILNRFIGDENICSTELDTLIDSRFETFKLYKKLVCTMGETNFGVLRKTSLLKKLVGGDLIGFEKKNKDPFDAENYAKILIASNSLPSSEDTSDGFMRRWMIIDFPNEFPEGKDIMETIPEMEYNNLSLKITKILPRLIESGKFHNQGTIEERKKKYISVSNPLSIFLNENCEQGDEFYVSYSQLYTEYVKYLQSHKRRKVKMGEFKGALESEGYYMERTTKKINDQFVSGRWIFGLKFKLPNGGEKSCDNYDNYDPTLPLTPIWETSSKKSVNRHNCHKTVSQETILVVLNTIQENKSGILFQDLAEQLKININLEKMEEIVKILKKNGQIFEPTPNLLMKL